MGALHAVFAKPSNVSLRGYGQSSKVSKTVNSCVALHVTLNSLVGPKRKREYELQASALKK
jgi:hypothetical protein